MKTTNPLFGRKWKISVYLKSGDTLIVSNSDTEIQSGALRCTFDIDRPGYQACYYGDIVIYNLNGPTEAKVINEGDRVTVEAGYIDGNYGKIFDGKVFQMFRERENVVDYKITLHCLDGLGIFDSNVVAFTLFAGSDQRDHIQNIAAQASTTIPLGSVSDNISTQKLPRGKVFFGEPVEYFRNIARDNNAQVYIQDGEVYMTKLVDGTTIGTDQAISITPETGLIGTPQITTAGIVFKVLLDPRIKIANPSMIVFLDPSKTSAQQQLLRIGQYPTILDKAGYYQIGRIRQHGDTRGNDWYTEITGINSLGKMPLLVQTAQMTPN